MSLGLRCVALLSESRAGGAGCAAPDVVPLRSCRKQVAFLLEGHHQGWIVQSCASHAASVVFARMQDEMWYFSKSTSVIAFTMGSMQSRSGRWSRCSTSTS